MSPEIHPATPVPPVVAATDFSTNAEAGVAWATSVAAELGAPLRLVHATLEATSYSDYLGLADETVTNLEERARAQLESLAAELVHRGLDTSWSMERGTPSEVVAGVAERRAARLIVIGTRGRRGLAHLLLGSTAKRVAQRAVGPVLSVHPEAATPHWPPRRPLVATDFSAEAAASLGALTGLWGENPVTPLHLLHACHIPYELGSENPCGSVTDGSELRRGIVGEVERRLADFAAAGARGFPVETEFCEGQPDDLILTRASEIGADLIVMGTRGRSGLAHVLLGSTAERVIQRATCPVLTSRAPQPSSRSGS